MVRKMEMARKMWKGEDGDSWGKMEIAGGRWRYRDKKVYRRIKCRYSCVNWKLSMRKRKYIFFLAKMHVQKEKKEFLSPWSETTT
jgi:hypothetical protein